MKALVLGAAVMTAAVLAILPVGLDWGEDVLVFLRGVLPVIGIFLGLILLFAGISDIKERAEKKKEKD
jgi:uncharacterized membrane protein YozB (DUF420 family)